MSEHEGPLTEEAMRGNRYRQKTVPFTEEAVKEYVDDCIRWWRDKREQHKLERDNERAYDDDLYIDCFQSVRASLFGELLP